jgi:hypothetical protein
MDRGSGRRRQSIVQKQHVETDESDSAQADGQTFQEADETDAETYQSNSAQAVQSTDTTSKADTEA